MIESNLKELAKQNIHSFSYLQVAYPGEPGILSGAAAHENFYCRMPEGVEFALNLLDAENPETDRICGALIMFNCKESLLTDDVRQQLEPLRDDPQPMVQKLVSAVLKK